MVIKKFINAIIFIYDKLNFKQLNAKFIKFNIMFDIFKLI